MRKVFRPITRRHLAILSFLALGSVVAMLPAAMLPASAAANANQCTNQSFGYLCEWWDAGYEGPFEAWTASKYPNTWRNESSYFNDEISSIIVWRNESESFVAENSNGNGEFACLKPRETYQDLTVYPWPNWSKSNDTISSIYNSNWNDGCKGWPRFNRVILNAPDRRTYHAPAEARPAPRRHSPPNGQRAASSR